jgi:NhaP-type Na+/H+ and K+/H+ antiporter
MNNFRVIEMTEETLFNVAFVVVLIAAAVVGCLDLFVWRP